jgi:Uma2 family endonuclease
VSLRESLSLTLVSRWPRIPTLSGGPDIAFLRNERVPARGKRGYFSGAPDLAIEVLSPEDRPREIREKVDGYLARGVPLVVVIDPNRKTATTFRPGTPSVALRSEIDVLDLNDVIPGFSCELREIFQ